MMRNISETKIILLILVIFSTCNKTEKFNNRKKQNKTEITCTYSACEGFYEGSEFINNKDIAHQFSNKMSAIVGEKLKELYQSKNYSKVDFENVKMTTDGMGSGNVLYKLTIPFSKVQNKCDAFTSFDHVGGWKHKPDLKSRKMQLKTVLMDGDSLNISSLKTTPENLQEYWMQWRNIDLQSGCN